MNAFEAIIDKIHKIIYNIGMLVKHFNNKGEKKDERY